MKEEIKFVLKRKIILSTFYGSAYEIIKKVRDPILKEILKASNKVKRSSI